MDAYTTVVRLPSRGVFYKDHPEMAGDITIKMMTAEDELAVYSSENDNLDELIESCIVSPKIDVSLLTPPDRHFLLMKIRILTYGDTYHIQASCPHCESPVRREYGYSLDSINVLELEAGTKADLKFKLPVSKDEVEVRVLTNGLLKKAKKKAQEMAEKVKADASRLERLYRIVFKIVSLNGETKNFAELESYVRSMPAKDRAYIDYKIDQFRYGYDMIAECSCPDCGKTFKVPFIMGGEFFRPRFDDESD